MAYKQERQAFERLKADCTPKAEAEYVASVGRVVGQYNTTLHENRFIVGGAVEIFTCCLLRTVGLACKHYADQETGGDILLPKNKHLSIKSSFVGPSDIRLINHQGKGNSEWTIATLFVISGVGIVYGDPSMVDDEDMKTPNDSKVLKRRGLVKLIKNNKNVMPVDIAKKPPTDLAGYSKKASSSIAKEALIEMESKILLSALRKI